MDRDHSDLESDLRHRLHAMAEAFPAGHANARLLRNLASNTHAFSTGALKSILQGA